MTTYPMTITRERQIRRRVHGSLALGAVSMLGSLALSVEGHRGWPCAPLSVSCLAYAVCGAVSVHRSDLAARRLPNGAPGSGVRAIPAPVPSVGTVIHVEVIEDSRKQVAA